MYIGVACMIHITIDNINLIRSVISGTDNIDIGYFIHAVAKTPKVKTVCWSFFLILFCLYAYTEKRRKNLKKLPKVPKIVYDNKPEAVAQMTLESWRITRQREREAVLRWLRVTSPFLP